MGKQTYKLIPTISFIKELRALSKKYPSIVEDVELLGAELMVKPTALGTSLGSNFYKIRMAIKSKGQGKSGGARVVVNVIVVDMVVGLISIYDKSEKDTISLHELREIFKTIKY